MLSLFLEEDLHVFLRNLARRRRWQTALIYRSYTTGRPADQVVILGQLLSLKD